MTNFKQKYQKYKEKYLKEKLSQLKIIQRGGIKKIIYSEEILDFVNRTITNGDIDSINNLKQAVYSCIYINMSDMKGICAPTARTVNCSVLEWLMFPFFTSSEVGMADFKLIEDKLNNNLVLHFGEGSTLYCDHFIKELYILFIYIYEKIQTILMINPTYNFIHITGHSMGSSLSILFSYFVMIIEKSTVEHMHIPSPDYFSANYNLKQVYDLTYVADIFSDYLKIIPPDIIITHGKNTYDKDINFEVIRQKTNELLAKKYPKINNKISICSVGAFPVLFRRTDKSQFDEFLSFYNNRFILFGNCNNGESLISPNIDDDFCDDKLFNMVLMNSADNTQISELTNFNFTNVNNLNVVDVNTVSPEFKFKFTFNNNTINKEIKPYDESSKMSSLLHMYIQNYNKLKKFVQVIEE